MKPRFSPETQAEALATRSAPSPLARLLAAISDTAKSTKARILAAAASGAVLLPGCSESEPGLYPQLTFLGEVTQGADSENTDDTETPGSTENDGASQDAQIIIGEDVVFSEDFVHGDAEGEPDAEEFVDEIQQTGKDAVFTIDTDDFDAENAIDIYTADTFQPEDTFTPDISQVEDTGSEEEVEVFTDTQTTQDTQIIEEIQEIPDTQTNPEDTGSGEDDTVSAEDTSSEDTTTEDVKVLNPIPGVDDDGDGFPNNIEQVQCGSSAVDNPNKYPGAPELCNAKDDNCDSAPGDTYYKEFNQFGVGTGKVYSGCEKETDLENGCKDGVDNDADGTSDQGDMDCPQLP